MRSEFTFAQICLFRACLDAWKSNAVGISACAFNVSSIWYLISSIEPQSISWSWCILNCLLPRGFADRHSGESPPPRKKNREELIGEPQTLILASLKCPAEVWDHCDVFVVSLSLFYSVHDLHFTTFARSILRSSFLIIHWMQPNFWSGKDFRY